MFRRGNSSIFIELVPLSVENLKAPVFRLVWCRDTKGGITVKAAFLVATALAASLFGGDVISASARTQEAPASSSPSRNLPYAAIHNPEFISASQASFMHANDRLIGVVVGKVAKAYPAAILSQHGLVEDSSPDGPIAITW